MCSFIPVPLRDSKAGAGSLSPRSVVWIEWDPRLFHMGRRKAELMRTLTPGPRLQMAPIGGLQEGRPWP